MGPIKKGILSGFAAGILMAIYSNTTSCHPSILGGGTEACAGPTEIVLGMLEFFLYFPLASLLGSVGIFLSGDLGFRILLTISPLIFLTIAGLIIGLSAKAFGKK